MMKSTRASLLLHPLFLISLCLLLLNDLFWKQHYHNWLTGKLSDVVGQVVFAVFLMALFPKQSRKLILLFCAVFFLWWKSPLSEPVLQFLRGRLSLPVGRVVDYTDLVALFFLPLTIYLKPVRLAISIPVRTALHYTTGLLALVSLCSTTAPYRYSQYYDLRENEIYFYESIKSPKTEEEIIEVLKNNGATIQKEQVRYFPLRQPDELWYKRKAADSTIQWVPVPHSNDSSIYVRSVASAPFYVVPVYVLDGDTLKNLEFTIDSTTKKKKVKSIISFRSFQTTQPEKYRDFYYGGLHKRYRKYFEQLFRM